MAIVKRRYVSALLIVFVVIVGSSAAVLADGTRDSLRLKYEAHWGDIPLGDVAVTLREAADRYAIQGSAVARGPMTLLFDWSGTAETQGRRRRGLRLPTSHVSTGSSDDGERRTTVDWKGAGLPLTTVVPPPDPEEVTPVPPASIAGTVDPLTVLLKTLDGLAKTGRCEGTARIYDGRRRYDIVIEHLGNGQLKADRPGAYAGPAVRCRLYAKKIGGFYRDATEWSSDEDEIERIAWIARLGNGLWVPVRAEVSAPLGNVVMRMITEPAKSAKKSQKPAVATDQHQ